MVEPPRRLSDAQLERAASPRLEVFLSHATGDHDKVAIVQRQIEALGVDVYLAEHDPQPGTSIAAKVDGALRRCHAVVVLLTAEGLNSTYVQHEVGLARGYGKPIIPVVEKHVDTTRLGLLGEVEYLELDLADPAESLARVTASLQPLVLAQAVVPQAPQAGAPGIDQALVLVGVGLLLGLLIAAWAFSDAGPSATG